MNPRGRLAWLVWCTAEALVLFGPPVVPGRAATAFVDDVDPRIGVLSENCVIGPCWPNGAIHPSPETPDLYSDWRLKPGNDGYSPNSPIVGFAQLHSSGTGGTASYGQLLLCPRVGAFDTDPDSSASGKSDEIARAEYYAVTLDRYGVRCEVVPTRHCAVYRFTFPEGVEPILVLNAGRKIKGPSLTKGSIGVSPSDRTIRGSGVYGENWQGVAFELHYYLSFSEPIRRFGTFSDGLVSDGESAATRDRPDPTAEFGAYVAFSTDGPRQVEVRVAVSFHSPERAEAWWQSEVGERTFEETRREAAAAWNERLGAVVIEGATHEQRTVFYTALMRCFVQPRDRTGDVAGVADGVPFWDDHYTLWDTYRSLWPLLLVIAPDVASNALNGFATILERSGRVGTATVATQMIPADHQGGTEVDNVIGDAFVKGLRGVDWQRLYDVTHHDTVYERPERYLELGYVGVSDSRISGSATLALALNDFCASHLACAFGRAGEAERLRVRAENWRALWDEHATQDGFSGFIRTRNGLGQFVGGVDEIPGYYEAGSWAYSFFVPHDVHELIRRCGGASRFNERLVHGYRTARLAFDNEVDFFAPWLHVYAGRPDLCTARVREMLELYTTSRYPGQEDSGAHGSRYVFAALGFYPNVGQPLYLLNGPLFPRATLALEDGKFLVIEAEPNPVANPYVQRVQRNGLPLDRAWITHEELLEGGTLEFVMGPAPSDWGRSQLPPSGFDELACSGVPPTSSRPFVHVFPRPATHAVHFRFDPIETSGEVSLRVFDGAGRIVRVVTHGAHVGRDQELVWDGTTEKGIDAPAGVYFYEVVSGAARERGHIVLVAR